MFRNRELAAKIAALTEDLEELRSEKNLLLASLAYSGEDAADKFPKDIAAMEQSLKRLEEQEQKYSAELDAALNEYAVLREQTKGFDPVQLYEARQAIRPGKEQEAENRAQQVYGEKYSPLLMFDSKKAVSRMLHEDMERQAVRRMVWQAQKEQQTFQNGATGSTENGVAGTEGAADFSKEKEQREGTVNRMPFPLYNTMAALKWISTHSRAVFNDSPCGLILILFFGTEKDHQKGSPRHRQECPPYQRLSVISCLGRRTAGLSSPVWGDEPPD